MAFRVTAPPPWCNAGVVQARATDRAPPESFEGRRGPSTVVFGRRGDACLLGMVALEELALSLDPLKRRLRPLRLMIA
jgi:hypothetical protein